MRSIGILFVCAVFLVAAAAYAADVDFKVVAFKSIDTGLEGSVAGAAPPALVLLESAEACNRIDGAVARAYPDSRTTLRQALGEYGDMDFRKFTYVGIFSHPIDNYGIDVKSVSHNKRTKLITIRFSYVWERRQYVRAPGLSIYFAVIRLPKTDAEIVADYGTESLPMVLKPAKIDAILPERKEDEKGFEVAAQGTIALNEAVERPGVGPFLYVLRSVEDIDKLNAKMRSNFRKASKGVADIMKREVSPDFGEYTYLVIFSAPCATATVTVEGVEYDEDMAEMLLTVAYRRMPAGKNEQANLIYSVVAVPGRDAQVMLLVRQSGGERRVSASAVEKRRTKAQTREEYDVRLESANFTVADILAQLGEWCVKNGLYEEGRRHLARALKFNPLNVRAARAMSELKVLETLRAEPSGAGECARRVPVLMRIGRFEAAEEHIGQALKMDPKCAEAHFARGAFEIFMRNFSTALESLNRAVDIDPTQARYFAARARCAAMMGRFDAAEKDVALALSLDRNSAPARSAGAVVLLARSSVEKDPAAAKKLIEQAKDLWAKAIELDPENAEFYSCRALAFLKLFALDGRREYLDNAFHDCVRSLQLNPYQYEPHLQLAGYYMYRQKPMRAEASLNRAVLAFPEMSYLYEQRGLFYMAVGDNEAALKDFEKFMELSPGEASGYFNRGMVKARQSKLIDALADFNKAVDIAPDEPRYYWERGLFHYTTGNLDSALKDFNKTLETGVPNASTYYMIGLVKLQTAKYREAVDNLEKCLQMKPDENLAKDAGARLEEARKKMGP